MRILCVLAIFLGAAAPGAFAQEDPDKPPAKQTFTGHRGVVMSLVFTPDGKSIVAAGGDENTVRVWDVATGKSEAWPAHPDLVRKVVLTPDSKTAAVSCRDGNVYLREFPSGKELHKLKRGGDVSGLAFSPDGTLLATLSSDQGNTSPTVVRLWDVSTGKKVLSWKAHNVWAHGVAFSPDGKTLATGGDDKLIHLWELPARK
jgi:WD40 repeat protein